MKTNILSLLVAIGVCAPVLRAGASPDSYCADVVRGAQELEAAGRLSAARARLSACMTGACTGTARQECAARVAAVDAALPRVTLVVKDGDGHDLRDARA